MQVVPIINRKYWIALVAASVFGTNTGDYLSVGLNLGNTAGLPYLAIALGAVFLVSWIIHWRTAIFFWITIIIIRTGATNIADYTHEYGGLGLLFLPPIIILFVVCVRWFKLRLEHLTQTLIIPKVDAVYWFCMIMAGIVGTLLGDYCSALIALIWFGVQYILGYTTDGFSLEWIWIGNLILCIPFFWWISRKISRSNMSTLALPYACWTLVAIIRTGGTAAGDYLAATRLQLIGAMIASGAVFILLIIKFYVIDRENQTEPLLIGSSA